MGRQTFTKLSRVTLDEVLNQAWPRSPVLYLLGTLNSLEAELIIYFHNRIRPKLNDKVANKKYWHAGKMWNYDTLEMLRKYFPEVSIMTLRRSIERLKEKKLLLTGHFHRDRSIRTTWYTVNYDELVRIGRPLPPQLPKKEHKIDPDKEKLFTSHLFKNPGKRTNAFVQKPSKMNKCICSKTRENEQMKDYIHTKDSSTDESRLRRSSRLTKAEVIQRNKAAEDTSGKGKLFQMTPEHHSGLGDMVKKGITEEQVAKAKDKLNLSQKVYVAEQLWFSLMSFYGVGTYLSMTAKEGRLLKTMIKRLSDAGVPPGDFMEFSVKNWSKIRKQLTWPDNPKKFRLGEKPFFQELFFNLNDILCIWERDHLSPNNMTPESAKTEYVYTRVEDIPKKHPRYKQLVAQVEIMGKAVTTIKGT